MLNQEHTPRISRVFALITDAYGGFGGIAVFNRDVLDAICHQPEITSVVAVPRLAPNPPEPLPPKLDYQFAATRGSVAYVASIVKALPYIARCDLIYCAHINLAPLAFVLAKVFRKPTLMALYGIEAWQPTHRRFTNWCALRMDRYYSISEYTKQRFLSWADVDATTIDLLPNAIHLRNYAPGLPDPDVVQRYGLTGKKVLLTLGRIVSRERAKGFDEVLDILPSLLPALPSLVYVIAGDGEYRPVLEDKVKKLGLGAHVVFTGRISEAEKLHLYRAADVYVMPSRGEGFGFVFLEAMACGVPVIASMTDGSRDAVRDGELGLLVHPDDSAGLRTAILAALKAQRGVPPGLSYFAFPEFARRLVDIMKRTTASSRAA